MLTIKEIEEALENIKDDIHLIETNKDIKVLQQAINELKSMREDYMSYKDLKNEYEHKLSHACLKLAEIRFGKDYKFLPKEVIQNKADEIRKEL